MVMFVLVGLEAQVQSASPLGTFMNCSPRHVFPGVQGPWHPPKHRLVLSKPKRPPRNHPQSPPGRPELWFDLGRFLFFLARRPVGSSLQELDQDQVGTLSLEQVMVMAPKGHALRLSNAQAELERKGPTVEVEDHGHQ